MYCFGKFCRICINKNEPLTNLHSTDTDSITFYDKLKYCNSDIINEDTNLFTFICLKCMNGLRQTYDFLRLIRSSENTLKNYVYALESSVKSPANLKSLMVKNYEELKIIYPVDENITNSDRKIFDERSGIEIIKLQPLEENEPEEHKNQLSLFTNNQDLLVEATSKSGRPRSVQVVNHSQINNFQTSSFYKPRTTKIVPNELLGFQPPSSVTETEIIRNTTTKSNILENDTGKEHKLVYLPSRVMNKDTRRKCRWCYKKRSHLWGREWAMKCKKVCTMCDACGIFLCSECFDDLHADVT